MNIDNYINHWKNLILKESNDFIYEESNQDVLSQLKSLKKEPIIGYDKEGNPVYVNYNKEKNVLWVNVNEEYIEVDYDNDYDLDYNLQALYDKILEVTEISESGQIDEAFKPSFLDVMKLIKKVYTPEEVEDLYSSTEVKITIEKNYEKLSQEEKNRIQELANNSTDYSKDELTDDEEAERDEIYELIEKTTQVEDEVEQTSEIVYFVTSQENELGSNTEKFPDEESAKTFVRTRLRSIKKDIKPEEVGTYRASENSFGKKLIPQYITQIDPNAVMVRFPKSSFEQDATSEQTSKENSIFLKEKDNPDSKPEPLNYWIEKYIEQKGIDKSNTGAVKAAKTKFRNAYNTGLVTGEKTGSWSEENFPILQTCDKNGNPVPRKRNKVETAPEEEEGSKLYTYIIYKQDLNPPKPLSKAAEETPAETTDNEEDEITSMDKSEEPSDTGNLYDKYAALDNDDDDDED